MRCRMHVHEACMKVDRLIESSAAIVALSRPLPPPTAARIFSLALDVDLYELLIVLILCLQAT
jgi:hypothetical protein